MNTARTAFGKIVDTGGDRPHRLRVHSIGLRRIRISSGVREAPGAWDRRVN